jgi:hypothetical protein
MEETELQIFDLVSAFGIGADVNVTYHKDFQVRDFQMLTETFALVQDFKLPVSVKKRHALDYTLALVEEATEEEKRQFREDVENMTEFDVQPPGLPGGISLDEERANGNGLAEAEALVRQRLSGRTHSDAGGS